MQLQRKRLGDILIEAGGLSQTQLERALAAQKEQGGRLGKVLVSLGILREEDILIALEKQLGYARIDLNEIVIHADAVEAVPLALAERYLIMPVKKEGRRLTLAMTDPTNFFAMDDIRLISGNEVVPVLATERDIREAIRRHYGVKGAVQKAVNRLRPEEAEMAAVQQVTSEDAPIISIVNSLISQAIKEKASDIHIEPLDDLVRVRYRVDGILREVVTFPKHTHAPILSRIKIMSEMDIAEKRLPQDGRINIHENGREVDIRVSTLPTIQGEKVVMRILDRRAVVLNMNSLGISPANMPLFRQLYAYSYGMVLVTGPTGSGKSTTLYSILSEINAPAKNIITVEDPVEYRMSGINQVQVNVKAGLTFANGLRSILRQDPNVIMVGEIRDQETADIAVRAALTGHLVFSTIHTNDASGAITRLIDMGVEPFLVASSVLGVVAQRLVRTICPECKEEYALPAEASERVFMGRQPDEPVALYRGRGCSHCNFTGYKGRLAIHEVLLLTPALRAMVARQASSDELLAVAKNEGLISMKEDGIAKALAGKTTIEEVIRVAYGSGDV